MDICWSFVYSYYMPDIPKINDYAFIGDCHSSALVSRYGSIDWCCLPRIDSPSCFGRLLDWKKGGYFHIRPKEHYQSSRRYLPHTMMLETHFVTDKGEAKLYDFYTMKQGGQQHPHAQILRIIEGIKGEIDFAVDIVPRFEYGTIKPWIRRYKITGFMALGGEHGLLFSGNSEFKLQNRNHLFSTFIVAPGKRVYLSMLYRKPEQLDDLLIEVPSIDELDSRFLETKIWWETWVSNGKFTGSYSELIERSALVLKSLTNSPTGAIAAAATTSLPESIGGQRNWDYRYSWIRDSYFSVKTLAHLGFVRAADGFRRFIERSSQGTAEGLQTLFSVTGQRRLTEFIIQDLVGYQGSAPVRIGNESANQLQLDMYGYLLNLAWNWHQLGSSPDSDYWYFLEHIVETVIKRWQEPDCGIWEVRIAPKHFVYSKMMCWVAIDRAIRLVKSLKYDRDISDWENVSQEIRFAIETKGYDAKRGVFKQAFDSDFMDASLLCMPMYDFIDYNDERMIRTTKLIQQELSEDGLIKRYPENFDGFPSKEGIFLPCSFWLVICLANQNRIEEANQIFKRVVSTSNDLGLFSEEYDLEKKEMLGNFPQAFTHLTFIEAALILDKVQGI